MDSLKETDMRYGTWNIGQVNQTNGRSVRRIQNKSQGKKIFPN
jgi:hypothetical protein